MTTPELAQGRQVEHATATRGRRRLNLIWESTQAVIALAVTATALLVAGSLASRGGDQSAFILLSGLANLVIGFYFGRTNHTRPEPVGGRRAVDEDGS